MAAHLCSSFQTVSLRQVCKRHLSGQCVAVFANACVSKSRESQVPTANRSCSIGRPVLSSSNLSCRRSSFGTGTQLQHQRPQVQFGLACQLSHTGKLILTTLLVSDLQIQQVQQNVQTVAGKLKTRKVNSLLTQTHSITSRQAALGISLTTRLLFRQQQRGSRSLAQARSSSGTQASSISMKRSLPSGCHS